MKHILILFILISNYCFGQVTLKDTAMTGVYDGGGKVVHFTGRVTGQVTIQNAIIEASPFQQIFDTTVTIGNNVRIKEFSAMWYGAKPSLQDNWWPIQKSIYACINRYPLYIPSGQYNISNPLLVGLFNYQTLLYSQSMLKMYGESSMWDNGSGTQIRYTGNSRFLINFQLNKGSEIHHLRFTGGWQSPGGTDMQYYSIPYASYTNQGAGGNCAGIAIDNYGTGPGGSTGIYFHDIIVEKFERLIEISNNTIFNAEILLFDRVQLGDGKVGIITSQAQEKGNIFRGLYSWGSLHTLLSIGNHGRGQAGNYYIDGANIAGRLVRIFNLNVAGWFPSYFQNMYCESFGSIGSISTWGPPIKIEKSVFDFALKTQVGSLTLLSSSSNRVKFDDCTFRYYDDSGTGLAFNGLATFENCDFSGAVTGNTGSVYIGYNPATMNIGSSQQVIGIRKDTVSVNQVNIIKK